MHRREWEVTVTLRSRRQHGIMYLSGKQALNEYRRIVAELGENGALVELEGEGFSIAVRSDDVESVTYGIANAA